MAPECFLDAVNVNCWKVKFQLLDAIGIGVWEQHESLVNCLAILVDLRFLRNQKM